jgi:hypothetical protein
VEGIRRNKIVGEFLDFRVRASIYRLNLHETFITAIYIEGKGRSKRRGGRREGGRRRRSTRSSTRRSRRREGRGRRKKGWYNFILFRDGKSKSLMNINGSLKRSQPQLSINILIAFWQLNNLVHGRRARMINFHKSLEAVVKDRLGEDSEARREKGCI